MGRPLQEPFGWLMFHEGFLIFSLDGVLLGTHAFAVLGNLLGIRWEHEALRTQDIGRAGEAVLRVGLPVRGCQRSVRPRGSQCP